MRSAFEAVVRFARASDASFLVDLGASAFRRYDGDAGGTVLRMLRQPGVEVLVVDSPEGRLGFAVVALRALGRPFGPWERPKVAHLDAIAIRPSARGRGIGERLLAHAEALAKSRGAVTMTLLTAATNVRAQRLFRGAGYTTSALFDGVYRGKERGLSMFKAL